MVQINDRIQGLLAERAGYARRGDTDGVAAVTEQLKLYGHEDAPDENPTGDDGATDDEKPADKPAEETPTPDETADDSTGEPDTDPADEDDDADATTPEEPDDAPVDAEPAAVATKRTTAKRPPRQKR